MCTVTIVPLIRALHGEPAVRLVCNRDELRTRPIARPPEIRTYRARRAILPIDPASDGTWVAVNDAGLILTLLNVNPLRDPSAPMPSRDGLRSRGTIIPSLLDCSTFDVCASRADAIEARAFPPFRLVIAGENRVAEFIGDGRCVRRGAEASIDRPLFFTSSGLGDHLVDGPRRDLFAEVFRTGRPAEWPGAQETFHGHVWPDRPHLSVCMSRAEAWTVSRTVVTSDMRSVRLDYWAGQPTPGTAPESIELPTCR